MSEETYVTISEEQLESMLKNAAEHGATEALKRIGLEDEHASRDVETIRNLLSAWRDTKTTFWRTAVKMFTTALLTGLAFAAWAQLQHGGPIK